MAFPTHNYPMHNLRRNSSAPTPSSRRRRRPRVVHVTPDSVSAPVPLFEFGRPPLATAPFFPRFDQGFNNNDCVTPEQHKMRTEIRDMESNLNALQERLITKRKQEIELKNENRKMSMGTIDCLQTSLNGMFLMGSEQKDIFTSILYIFKEFDKRLKSLESSLLPPAPTHPIPPADPCPCCVGTSADTARTSAMRRTVEELATEAEAKGDNMRANLIREAQSSRENDFGSDNDLFDRLNELQKKEEEETPLKQTKITEFINRVPNPSGSFMLHNSPPCSPLVSPRPVAPSSVSETSSPAAAGWDMDDCDWNDGTKFTDFDALDTKIKDQPPYLSTNL